MKDVNLACGVDTLFGFLETNKNYSNFLIDLLNQVEDKKAIFERNDIDYTNKDIYIKINNMSLQYLNKAEGFYWFKCINKYFRIGFKDENTNKRLHNIRVQLQGIGIYEVGIKPLISLIKNDLLKDITTGLFLVTRADINCFVNYDLSYIDKTMFATRKQRYHTISEHGTSTKMQTIYVGKPPFMLRLYNKILELQKSKKKEMMYEYFATNGLDVEKPIFNVEFEMHRPHLKAYGIDTIDDLLSNANMLFKKATKDIRLVDTSNVTDKDIKNNSKNRAKSQTIWQHIHDKFDIKDFMQLDAPLERIKKRSYVYDLDKFSDEICVILKKGVIHRVGVFPELLSDITEHFLDEMENKEEQRKKENTLKKKYIPVTIENDNNQYRLLDNGELIKPINIVPFNKLNDVELEQEIIRLESEFYFEDNDNKEIIAQKLEIANREKNSRGV